VSVAIFSVEFVPTVRMFLKSSKEYRYGGVFVWVCLFVHVAEVIPVDCDSILVCATHTTVPDHERCD
jgi:hypothetical protein